MQTETSGELHGFGGGLDNHNGGRRVVVGDGEARETRGAERVVRTGRERDDDVFGAFGARVVDGRGDECGTGGAGGNREARAKRSVVGAAGGSAGDGERHGERSGRGAGARDGEGARIGSRFRGRGVGRGDGDDGRVGIRDRDGNGGGGADSVGGVGGEREANGLGRFVDCIGERRECARSAGRAAGDREGRAEGGVVGATRGGAGDGERHGERNRGAAGTRERPLARVAVFGGVGIGGGERDDRRIIIGDRDGMRSGGGERRAAGDGERQHHGLGGFDDGVAAERERDEFRGLAGREAERTCGQREIGTGCGGAAGDGIIHRDGGGGGLAERDKHSGRAALGDGAGGGGETYGGLERRDVVVADNEDVLVERGRERGAVGIAQREHDVLVGLGQQIIDEVERNRRRGDAGSEGEHAGRKAVVDAESTSGIRGGGAGVELRESGPALGDEHVAGIAAKVFAHHHAGEAAIRGAGTGDDARHKREITAGREIHEVERVRRRRGDRRARAGERISAGGDAKGAGGRD